MTECNEEVGCGIHAECVDSICVCDEGFFVNQDFLGELTSDCVGNKAALISLYSPVIFFYVGNVLVYLFYVKKWSQLRRLVPFLFANIVQVTFLMRKVISVDEVFFGHDVSATVFMALSWPLMYSGSHVFFTKYVTLQFKLLVLKPMDQGRILKFLEIIMKLADLSATVAGALIITTLFVGYQHIQILWKCVIGLILFCACTHGICFFKLTEALKKDLAPVAHRDVKFQETINRTNGVKWSASLIHILFVFVLVPPLAVPGELGLYVYQYSFPIGTYIYCTACIGVVASNRFKMKRSTNTPNASHARLMVGISRDGTDSVKNASSDNKNASVGKLANASHNQSSQKLLSMI